MVLLGPKKWKDYSQGFKVERQSIRLPDGSLKEVGESKIDIELHAEVIASINLSIKANKLNSYLFLNFQWENTLLSYEK